MRILRALCDGLLHRCPRCHQGRMFTSWFTMRRTCPTCDLEFERASGEVSGGMAVNFVLTIFVLLAGSLFALSPTVPLYPLMGGLFAFALLFPILFYPSSRGLWAALLYLTGDNAEGDSVKHRED